MKSSEKYINALKFAAIKHNGQFRIGGLPYITHPIEVSLILREKGYDDDYQIAGLFHDLLEDTDATQTEIEQLGGINVLNAVKLLTKTDGYVMADYVGAIKANPIARAVKAADRLHNLRSAVVADADFKRRYILESIDWYLDFDPEISKAVKALSDSLNEPMYNLPLEYRPIDYDEELKG